MTLTELNRREVRRAFDRAAAGYDAHAALQAEVGARLLERLDYAPTDSRCILDLGCGTGHASEALAQRFPDARVVALDWAPAMLAETARNAPSASAVCADLMALPLAARQFDLVFSNLALQWVTDWPAALAGLRRILKPDGLLLFSTFGPDTLQELRSAWAEVDDDVHVNEFPDLHDVGDLLVRSGFSEPVMDADRLTVTYADPLTMMRELKAIGAHNAARARRRGLTGRRTLRRLLSAFEAYGTDDGRYPATYEVVYGAAFGPQEGQPIRDAGGEVATFSVESLRRR